MIKIIYILLYLLFSTGGLVFIKIGTDGTKIEVTKYFLSATLNWKLLIGFCLYILSFILYTVVISKFNLSYIYPILTAVLFILVMISSAIILKETVSTSQIIGAIIITVGVLITIFKK